MQRICALYRTTVGKKVLMAVTGLVLFVFVVGHLAGNLKLFQGQEKFDAYAHFLREAGYPLLAHGQMLWAVRIVLLLAVFVHVLSAAQLTLTSYAARPVAYQRAVEPLGFSYASYTMRWGGVLIALYVVYHLLHLTFGTAHGDFNPASPYHNVVAGLRVWWVSLVYMAVQVPLGFHLYHGLWSAMQTLGVNHPVINAMRRPLAAVVALVIVIGYLSIPVAVLTGVVG